MKKWISILKKVLFVAGIMAITTAFIYILSASLNRHDHLVCKNIQANIDLDSGVEFLSNAEIIGLMNFAGGDSLPGKLLTGIDIRLIEREVSKNPYVDHAEVYINQQQEIIADIIQKIPLFRVINNDGVSYYISNKNDRIPLSNNFTAHVALVIGNVETHTNTQRDSIMQSDLFRLMTFVESDTVLNALIDQVFVNAADELELMPKTGYHNIRFGAVDEMMSDKFERLKIFYREAMSKVGWDKYKTIDLRFRDQVVCEKRDSIVQKFIP